MSCALFGLWNPHGYISARLQPPKTLTSVNISVSISRSETTQADAMREGETSSRSCTHTHTHTVHSVLREELTGCRRQLTLLCETQKDTLFLNGTDVFIKSAVKGLHWYRRLIYHRYHRSDKLYRYTSIIQISLTTTSLTIITLRWFTLFIPVQKIIIMTILNHFMADSYEFVLICKFSNNRLMP